MAQNDAVPHRTRRVLYVISCGSPAARFVPAFVQMVQADEWQVCVIATPDGSKFVDIALLERITGSPVRTEYKHPDEPDVLPPADVVVAYPATFNTLNKWVLGISDTLVSRSANWLTNQGAEADDGGHARQRSTEDAVAADRGRAHGAGA